MWNKDDLSIALSENLKKPIINDFQLEEVFIDSRKNSKKGLFIALKGENKDGHNFIKQAFENGANASIVEHIPADCEEFKDKLIVVRDSYQAMYDLAKYARERTKAKIIAITGSVGKTGTKEMLKMVFSSQGKTYATSGNLNNHIGLPLSLSNLPSNYDYGIFEIGMNHLKEIEPLSNLLKPHITAITNVGPVHIEFFKNEQEIALAKSEIFSGLVENGHILLNRDNTHFEFLYNRAKLNNVKSENIISFGKNFSSDYQLINNQIKKIDLSLITVKLKNGREVSYEIGVSNESLAFNSLIAVGCLDLCGKNLPTGLATLKEFSSTGGRGKINEVNVQNKRITIIDDSYNASVLSMKSGLQNAINTKKLLHKKRVVCALGDMLELGDESEKLHKEVIEFAENNHFDFVILVGEKMTKASKNLTTKSFITFPDSVSASKSIFELLADDDILYVKGSRGIKMEKLIENLTNENSAH